MIRRSIAVLLVVAVCAFLGFTAFKWSQRTDSTLFGPLFTHGSRTQPVVALTFDDGPNPPYTEAILTILERAHVHATFFVVGRAVVAHRKTIAREARDGDAIEDHSWSHEHLILESPSAVRRSLRRTSVAIHRITGTAPTLMRPPFGQRDGWVLAAAQREHLIPVLWSVPLAYDWESPPPTVIATRILSHVHSGDIIVLHDGNRGEPADRQASVRATALIIAALKARGFAFVTVPELMHRSCRQPEESRPRGCAADRDEQNARTAIAPDREPSHRAPKSHPPDGP